VELLVADLTDELAGAGHSVTLFASGDSTTKGVLRSAHRKALNDDPTIVEPEIYRMLQVQDVLDCENDFDLIHSHVHSNTGCLAIPFLAQCRTPVVHTVHCFFNQDNLLLFTRFAEQRYVAISADQRRRLPHLNYLATIHHGIRVERFPFYQHPSTPPYLAFLGRIREEKRPHVAIAAARKAGLLLRMAGRVKPVDQRYFRDEIEPHIDGINVEYLGELDFLGKTALLGGAVATLVPTWLPEPFGLVTIESLACGTPVIASKGGAIEELLVGGGTGMIVSSDFELSDAVAVVARFDRRACRSNVESRFSLNRMVRAYESVYRAVLAAESAMPRPWDQPL
jgi:glycosyltransferase involved in cell wall biosynthesis